MIESAYRTVIKTFSWRLFATIDTIVISYFITGSMIMASSIAVIEVCTKLLLYYIHERAWNRISFLRNDYSSKINFLTKKRRYK